jgi:prepilin-type N-terminal cleavage/methylation domain-containing protein
MKQNVISARRQGFTLIELVVVITILGILAAVAVPKFLSLDSDAKSAAVKGGAAAVAGAAVISYSKKAASGGSIPVTFASISANTTLDSNLVLSGNCTAAKVKYSSTTTISATANIAAFCSG